MISSLSYYLAQVMRGGFPYFIEEEGCPVGLGQPVGKPPAKTVEQHGFMVLPGTQPGKYTVTLHSNIYCDTDVPEQQFDITVT